ncbi:MAG: UDP-3-O-acyl-N-acetylglucosamine deacetylase, partial [Nanoarchaeota archaeon]|nr:UDP-3-O-acyl-N-acetylglucosamine deacetylase [Nanoarchaeota archaeon]
MEFQKTIQKPIETRKGVNVYTGEEVSIKFEPAVENTGIIFLVNGEEIKVELDLARFENKSIFVGKVGVTEHLLAPIYALGIDNLVIKMDFTKEPYACPGFENMAVEIVDVLKSAGIKEQSAQKRFLSVDKEIKIQHENPEKKDSIIITPADDFIIEYRVFYPHLEVGEQVFSFNVGEHNFCSDVIEARSPAFVENGGLDNFTISNKTHLLIGKGEAKYQGQEFVRHKVLDFLGTLALFGKQFKNTKFCVNMSGHEFDLFALKKMKNNFVEYSSKTKQPASKIKFLDLKKHNKQIFSEILDAVKRNCENSNFILGPAVEEFEKNFADFIGTKYAVAVNSGTAALHLSLLALGIKKGDEVITTPYTFFATIEAILYCGAKPVFVDINPDTFNIDVDKIEEKINFNTRAILPIHLYGQSVDMDRIMEIAKRHNFLVIEDACQAHGAEYNGKKVGGIGDVGCFSFYPSKNLSGWGEGGIITTNNEEVAEKIKKLRNHGSNAKYQHESIGFNERMNGVQGAVLNTKLKYLNEWNEKRRRRAELYNELLKNLPIILPKENGKHVYHLYTIKTSRRNELKRFLEEQGIETAIHYEMPLHLQKACENLKYKIGDLPNAEKVSREVLALPLNPELKKEEIEFVAEKIKNFFEIAQQKISCSVPVLTLNSSKYLERCLNSIKDVNEIIVMDGNSADNTLEIARKYNAKIYRQFPTNEPNQKIENFTEMRLKLWGKTTEPWLLLLDSDEFATPELMQEIREIVLKNEKNVAYEIPRRQILKNGRIIKHSFSYPYNYLRLFHRESGVSLKKKVVHEQMHVPENVEVRLTKNYLLTDLPPNKECREKDNGYLKLTLSSAHEFTWKKIFWKAWLNVGKGGYIGLKSAKIYFKHGFKDSLPPKYVWRFMRYHF